MVRLGELDRDPTRFAQITEVGVDEHIWHHKPGRGKPPKAVTGMVNLDRDDTGRQRAKLLDLVLGRSGPVYADMLDKLDEDTRKNIQVATLDPFQGYKNAIDDKLADALAVVDHFHIEKLAIKMVDDVRCRLQNEHYGRRARRGDEMFGVMKILRANRDNLNDRQITRIDKVLDDERFKDLKHAYNKREELREALDCTDIKDGIAKMTKVLDTFYKSKVPEVAKLGRTLRRWRQPLLNFFKSNRSTNAGAESINNLIELHRRIARGFRNFDNYRLRCLLIAGAFD